MFVVFKLNYKDQNNLIMKNRNLLEGILLMALLLIVPELAFGQAPPPPGVPFDFGLSALIAATVGYGAMKMRKNKD